MTNNTVFSYKLMQICTYIIVLVVISNIPETYGNDDVYCYKNIK